MQRLERSSYVNEPEPPRPKLIRESQQTERRCMQILLLSFGLLCLIQATLNITLRLTDSETQSSLPWETVTDTRHTTQQCNQLQERVNTLARDKNHLEEKIAELTTQINGLNNQKLNTQNQKQQTQELTRQNQELTRQNQELTRQNQELNRLTQELTRQTEELNRQTEELNRQTQDLTRQNQELNRQTQELTRQNQELTRQIQELTRQTQGLTRQNQELTRQNQGLTRQNQGLKGQTQEERDQLQDTLNGRSVCPDGWREIRGRCYFLSNEMRSWDSSRMYCQGYGADLVVINDVQEQKDVYGMTNNPYWLFWIGLHGDTRRGTFKWVDNSPLTVAFWQVGQPDYGGPNNQENCVETYVRKPVFFSWNDAPCGNLLKWICEKAALK